VVVIVACVAGSERLDGVPEGVLAAFRLAGAVPVRLPGGQGTAWRAGRVVLKPADSVREGRWFAEVYDALTGPGFRVPRPVWALTGDWVALGWTAYRWVPGTAADWSGVSPRWPDMVAVSRALNAALIGVPVPPWRATVGNPWTIGDEVAWGERDPDPLLGPGAGPLAGQVRRLLAALMWRRASPEVLRYLSGEPELGQLLARALVYRLVTEIVRHAGTAGVDAAARAAQPVADLVLARLALRARRGE